MLYWCNFGDQERRCFHNAKTCDQPLDVFRQAAVESLTQSCCTSLKGHPILGGLRRLRAEGRCQYRKAPSGGVEVTVDHADQQVIAGKRTKKVILMELS